MQKRKNVKCDQFDHYRLQTKGLLSAKTGTVPRNTLKKQLRVTPIQHFSLTEKTCWRRNGC